MDSFWRHVVIKKYLFIVGALFSFPAFAVSQYGNVTSGNTACWEGNQLVKDCGSAGIVTSFTGDGTIITNSASTGAVNATLGNALANSVLGNNTFFGASPAYQTSINLFNVIASIPAILVGTTTFTPAADIVVGHNNEAFTLSASCPCTIANPTGTPFDTQKLTLIITQSSGGSNTIGTWGGNYDFGTPGAPTLSTAPNARDYIGFQYNSSAGKWDYIGDALGH